jgi:RNA polymerase-binding transcription factor DksA
MNEPASATIPYPVDYQLSIARTIELRLQKLRASGAAEEVRRLEDCLARLQRPDFGACDDCGALIAFMRLAADPAVRYCDHCGEEQGRPPW